MKRISHTVHGDHVLITAELATANVVARDATTVAITMQDIEWRQAARAVLKECNAAEHKLPPELVVHRVRAALEDAAMRAMEVEGGHVARLRFASTVMHRLADLMQAGTIVDVEVDWARDSQHLISVSFQTERRPCEITLELGRGIVQECGCSTGVLGDDGRMVHAEDCAMKETP